MRVDDFDYELPPDRIAARPVEPRDSARLMVFDRQSGRTEHRLFRDLPELLCARDLLVVNDTRVLPWRLRGRRASGGAVEVLLFERTAAGFVGCGKPARKLRVGEPVSIEDGALTLVPLAARGAGVFEFALRAASGEEAATVLERVGRAPLPPYIPRGVDDDVAGDRAHYQTVFATHDGAIAAPTAGLHFTPDLLRRLREAQVARATVTLHVGFGTFAPIRVADVEQHAMHRERFALPEATAQAVAAARAVGARVVAVGTTVARTLETCARPDRTVRPDSGETDLFLFPGRPLRVVDALITNFHLPRSTLLMLVAAMVGREQVLALYRDAIERGYRFYSFGDAMLIT